jgi:Uncharacterised nucleotidyltransferase
MVSLSPEFVLTAACCVWPPSDRRTQAIRAAAAGRLDWARFLRMVARHRVVGLVHHGLTQARCEIPPDIAQEIAARAAALVRQNVALAGEAVRLQRAFDEAKVPVVFMKGVSLAMLAYGNVALRHAKDIDLLVASESINAANAVLARAGYCRFEPNAGFSSSQLRTWALRCKELVYVRDDVGLHVELHARAFDNPHLMPELSAIGPLRAVTLATGVGVRTFGEDRLFAYLCTHGALHSWFRLKWLADIRALLAYQPAGGVERLYRAAEAAGVGRPAAQAIRLCQRVLGLELPDGLAAELGGQVVSRWLESIAMHAMTADADLIDLPFRSMWSDLWHFTLARGWRYRSAELKVQLINPADISVFPLPRSLQFLYPMVRLPLSLWRHGFLVSRPSPRQAGDS